MNKFILSLIAIFISVTNLFAQEAVGAFYRYNDKLNNMYPDWKLTYDLNRILKELV
jgi:hypothetical protein